MFFSSKHDSEIVCRLCLSSSSNQNVSMKHKIGCDQQEITIIKTLNESHLNWKSTSIRFYFIVGFMQFLNLSLSKSSIFLKKVLKELKFLSKILMVMVILKSLKFLLCEKVNIMNRLWNIILLIGLWMRL